jgi:hypothetical protein
MALEALVVVQVSAAFRTGCQMLVKRFPFGVGQGVVNVAVKLFVG